MTAFPLPITSYRPNHDTTMDTFLSAVLGDLLSRSISFMIDRYYQQHQDVEENLQRLHRLLLRIQAIVEEADSRHIKNQAMLLQLRMVRGMVYRGYYFLDDFKYRIIQGNAKDEVGNHSLDLSPFSPFKRFCLSTRTRKIVSDVLEKKELQKMLGHLESIVSDMQEFVVFLSSYPRMSRQPYCSYFLLENCMFGRQAEQERVINFLLEPNHPSDTESIDVLPIIGPGRVGKSTLVEHVCRDERVRKYFSTIVFYGPDGIGGGDLALTAETGLIKHRNPASIEQSLLIIELVDDMDDETWRRMLDSLRDHIAPVRKIILTSPSNKIATFGTTEALHLHFLPKEAFWYFFKTIAFGSTNPEEEPKLASIYMDIATIVKGSFMATHMIAGILRSNRSIRFWYRFLECLKYYIDMHIRVLGEHPSDAYIKKSGFTYIWTPRNMCVIAATYSRYQVSSAQLADIPMIPSSDILTGNVELPEKYDVLDWQSSIPPYYSYVTHYEVLARPPHMLPKRKRSRALSEGLV